MTGVRILVGDCRARLAELEDKSVHCVVTSPPYFSLRDYGSAGQIGLEQTPGAYVTALVEVCRLIRRVLRDDGSVWINLGDCYASSGGLGRGENLHRIGRSHQQRSVRPMLTRGKRGVDRWGGGDINAAMVGLKPKNLMLIPWRVAIALQDDGWIIREDIVWSKPNPMTESVEDRLTRSHEVLLHIAKDSRRPKIWLSRDTREWSNSPDLKELVTNTSKNAKFRERKPLINRWKAFDYYHDAMAIAEPVLQDSVARSERGRSTTHKYADGGPLGQTIGIVSPSAGRPRTNSSGVHERKTKASVGLITSGNAKDIGWTVPWEGSMRNKRSVWHVAPEPFSGDHFAAFPPSLIEPCILASCPPGGTVLDPFGGAGTTGMVAQRHGRAAILIELSEKYAAIAQRRIKADLGRASGADEEHGLEPLPLFRIAG